MDRLLTGPRIVHGDGTEVIMETGQAIIVREGIAIIIVQGQMWSLTDREVDIPSREAVIADLAAVITIYIVTGSMSFRRGIMFSGR